MNKKQFHELTQNRIILLDGATGTNLVRAGMPSGVCPEQWILDHPEVIIDLQTRYVDAGSNIIYAPTFSANLIKLKEYGLEEQADRINTELVTISKEVAGKRAFVAGDITMTGRQLLPVGDLEFEDLIAVYKHQIRTLADAGCDLLTVETMMSLQECRAAIIAAKETTDIPVICTLTFQDDGHTLYGTDAATAAVVLDKLGADAVGINCSTGPDKMAVLIKQMSAVTDIPVIAKPNAGMPHIASNGATEYDMSAEAFAAGMDKLVKSGASIIGGCCGTTPEYIALLKKKYQDDTFNTNSDNKCNFNKEFFNSDTRYLASERKLFSFGAHDPFIIIGERINPTGKKKLQEELKRGCMDLVCEYANTQEADGASILDVNVGMSGVDEPELLLQVIKEVSVETALPLCIDTSNEEAMEKALRYYPGRALVNSCSLEKGRPENLLPIIRKYGAMFILLPVGENGIPRDNAEKEANILKLTRLAMEYGLSKEDIIVDGLVATVGADGAAAGKTLETIRFCRDNGYASVCGLSNISFGLPQRSFINSAFLTMAIANGLTMAIANPSQELLVSTAFASDLLMNKDNSDMRYIERMDRYGQIPVRLTTCKTYAENIPSAGTATGGTLSGGEKANISNQSSGFQIQNNHNANVAFDNMKTDYIALLHNDVLKGIKRSIVSDTQRAIDDGIQAKKLLDESLIPAINDVGSLYDSGRYFLPQLIASAEAMKMSIAILEPLLQAQDGSEASDKPVIVIATVKGDIHDIGKNLVALMLRNYGFEVIDLGKDVQTETIVDTAIVKKASVIALSALMTTTMQEMRNVVKYAREKNCKSKIIIGGAVVTDDYAMEIGADGYSRDAAAAVKVVKKILNIVRQD